MGEFSELTLPALSPLTPERASSFADMIGRIWSRGYERDDAPLGEPYMTWDMDLHARSLLVKRANDAAPEKLDGWSFTPHMSETKQPIGARFELRFGGRRAPFFIGERVAFDGLQAHLNGNEFERIIPDATAEPLAASEWDLWGQGNTRDVSAHYERVIHPRVVDAIITISARAPERELKVMDLGGGDGALAERICKRASRVTAMVMVEQSDALLAKAKARAAKFPGRFGVEKGDLASPDLAPIFARTPDIVVLSGVVALQVMTRAQGLRVMQACFDALAPGGFAIVPSFSPGLLSSRDYEPMGFVVHNKSLHLVETSPLERTLKTHDFYILEKPQKQG